MCIAGREKWPEMALGGFFVEKLSFTVVSLFQLFEKKLNTAGHLVLIGGIPWGLVS